MVYIYFLKHYLTLFIGILISYIWTKVQYHLAYLTNQIQKARFLIIIKVQETHLFTSTNTLSLCNFEMPFLFFLHCLILSFDRIQEMKRFNLLFKHADNKIYILSYNLCDMYEQ